MNPQSTPASQDSHAHIYNGVYNYTERLKKDKLRGAGTFMVGVAIEVRAQSMRQIGWQRDVSFVVLLGELAHALSR